MTISSLAFYVMAFRVPVVGHLIKISMKHGKLTRLKQKRLFHILTAVITTFAANSYFTMASGDGIYTNKYTEKITNKHVPDTFKYIYRDVYWARYVDWSLTTPLLLLDLAFLAGLSGADILVAIVADLIMILTGLFAAFSRNESAQWGYYTIACIAYLVVIYKLAVPGRAKAMGKDSKTGTFFTAIAGFTLVLWTIYPMYAKSYAF